MFTLDIDRPPLVCNIKFETLQVEVEGIADKESYRKKLKI